MSTTVISRALGRQYDRPSSNEKNSRFRTAYNIPRNLNALSIFACDIILRVGHKRLLDVNIITNYVKKLRLYSHGSLNGKYQDSLPEYFVPYRHN